MCSTAHGAESFVTLNPKLLTLCRDGYLTRDELRSAFPKANIDSLIREADSNGDGRVSRSEYDKVLGKHEATEAYKVTSD